MVDTNKRTTPAYIKCYKFDIQTPMVEQTLIIEFLEMYRNPKWELLFCWGPIWTPLIRIGSAQKWTHVRPAGRLTGRPADRPATMLDPCWSNMGAMLVGANADQGGQEAVYVGCVEPWNIPIGEDGTQEWPIWVFYREWTYRRKFGF